VSSFFVYYLYQGLLEISGIDRAVGTLGAFLVLGHNADVVSTEAAMGTLLVVGVLLTILVYFPVPLMYAWHAKWLAERLNMPPERQKSSVVPIDLG
jgi:hypothetical protein